MKNAFQKSPYAATAAVFLVLLVVGHVFWGWGALTTAFCLLLYCIVAVAIKLDDITQRLEGLSQQIEGLNAAPASDAAVQHPPATSLISHEDTGPTGGPDASKNF